MPVSEMSGFTRNSDIRPGRFRVFSFGVSGFVFAGDFVDTLALRLPGGTGCPSHNTSTGERDEGRVRAPGGPRLGHRRPVRGPGRGPARRHARGARRRPDPEPRRPGRRAPAAAPRQGAVPARGGAAGAPADDGRGRHLAALLLRGRGLRHRLLLGRPDPVRGPQPAPGRPLLRDRRRAGRVLAAPDRHADDVPAVRVRRPAPWLGALRPAGRRPADGPAARPLGRRRGGAPRRRPGRARAPWAAAVRRR